MLAAYLFRTGVFGRLDFYTHITTLVLQALMAGHLMKRLGVHATLALLPTTALLGFAPRPRRVARRGPRVIYLMPEDAAERDLDLVGNAEVAGPIIEKSS